MKIVKQDKQGQKLLSTAEIDVSKLTNLNKKSIAILKGLSKKSMYPKELSRTLDLNEQLVYYYINKLKNMGFIEIERIRKINGVTAKVYRLTSDSFFFKFGDFKRGIKIKENEHYLLNGFIRDGKLQSLIVVGSPDPHGKMKVRSRDGYLGIDLALFLGSFTKGSQENKVRMDLTITDEEMKRHNLIVIGGPVVNRVANLCVRKIPIYIDPSKKRIISTISKKEYFGENQGVVCICDNPFNEKKKLIYIAGLKYSGTRSAIVAVKKYLHHIEKGNSKNKKIFAKVVEGYDLDKDGYIDEVTFLE
jgi:DNA-binding transcriptional ArsR family regulator